MEIIDKKWKQTLRLRLEHSPCHIIIRYELSINILSLEPCKAYFLSVEVLDLKRLICSGSKEKDNER